MFLRELRIENFRAIRAGTFSFDDGTALIGENDCGISSVLDALELVLGGEPEGGTYPPWLFYRDPETDEVAGPIRIRLKFAEREEGEWQTEALASLSPLLSPQRTPVREIVYEIRIQPGPDEFGRARFALGSPGKRAEAAEPAIIGRFRRLNPVIRVSAGMLTGRGGWGLASQDRSTAKFRMSPDIQALVDRINRAVDSRFSRTSLCPHRELDDGFHAAAQLVRLRGIDLDHREYGLTRSVREILGWQSDRAGLVAAEPLNDPGSEPEKLGLLLLIGALLRAWPEGMAADAEPLWIIEEPEAHLHPMTLTSVAELVGLIPRQKIVTTYSGDLLSAIPLTQVRRLVRHDGVLHERRVREHVLSRSEMRRFHHHLRAGYGSATFARLWLLVEGESEYWVLPQLARLMGYDFALEGIVCIEFAQCGLDPPIKVARALGIQWHLLADGDPAGRAYASAAGRYIDDAIPEERLTVLAEPDIERCFWAHGYDGVYRKHAKLKGRQVDQAAPARVIRVAVKKRSKPFLALRIVDAIASADSRGVPPRLGRMIETCVELARNAPARLAAAR